jgi:hypothetical protein
MKLKMETVKQPIIAIISPKQGTKNDINVVIKTIIHLTSNLIENEGSRSISLKPPLKIDWYLYLLKPYCIINCSIMCDGGMNVKGNVVRHVNAIEIRTIIATYDSVGKLTNRFSCKPLGSLMYNIASPSPTTKYINQTNANAMNTTFPIFSLFIILSSIGKIRDGNPKQNIATPTAKPKPYNEVGQ